MTDVLKISTEIKNQHNERISNKIDRINESIKIAMDEGQYFTDFNIMREDPDYKEIKRKYENEGYCFKHKSSRWTGNAWVITELIYW